MSINPQKFGSKEVADVTFYEILTNKPVLIFDSLKMVNQEHSGDTVFARGGKGNPKLIGWDYNREITFNMQDALLSQKSMSLLAGTEVVTGADITVTEQLPVIDTAGSLSVVLSKMPATVTPTILYMYADLDAGEEVIGDSTDVGFSGDVDYTVTSSDNEVDLTDSSSNIAEGDIIVVTYTYPSTTATKVVFNSDDYPGTYKIVGDSVIRNTSGVDVAYQTVVHKAKLLPGFTMEIAAEGDPSVFDFSIDIMKQDGGTAMIEYIQY